MDTIHTTHPPLYPKKKFWKISKVINHEYLYIGRRVAEWLAHSTAKQKVTGSNPSRASGWKTPSVHPAVKWVPDLIQGRKGSGRRGMGSAFHMLCPRHDEPLTVRRPNGQYAMGPPLPLPFLTVHRSKNKGIAAHL